MLISEKYMNIIEELDNDNSDEFKMKDDIDKMKS